MDAPKTNRFIQAAVLFSSTSTLICCALPALFISLGMGATFAGLIGAVPQLVWFSEHKEVVFSIAGGFIVLSAVFSYRSRNAPCPLDPKLTEACTRTRVWSKCVFRFSVTAYLVGAFFAFVAPFF